MQTCYYLTDLPTELLNDQGLTKTLLTRRETIYLKHILKNIFIYGNDDELKNKLDMLQFSSLFEYMGFITNKLRAVYKYPREYTVDDADELVKQRRESFCKTLELYEPLKPIIVLDFDRTVTNEKFHSLYRYLIDDYKVIINSANPQMEVIEQYLDKHGFQQPDVIYANKGKQKKIVRLKNIAVTNMHKPIFYIDDEQEYLEYGMLLTMYCYQYTTGGKIKSYTGFKK